MRFRNCAGAALCLAIAALCAAPTQADPAAGRAVALGQTAALAASERLRTFAWGKWLETGPAPRSVVGAMRGALERQGFYHDGATPRLVWRDFRAAPLIAYESNVNGGLAQDSFTFGDYVFTADPALRALPGVVLGIEASGAARLAWGTGRLVEIMGEGALGWAPTEDLGFHRGAVQLCSRNNLVRWVFLDGCLLGAANARSLSSANLGRASLALSTLFETPVGYHELRGELAQTHADTYDQATATLSLATVWTHAVTEMSLTLGAPVEGQTVLDHRASLDLRWMAGARPVSIGLWHSVSNGGQFLGLAREDRSLGLTLSWQARPGVTFELGYARIDSTADLFDDESASFRVRLGDFRF
ncbi:hypothetical protein [Oceaniglobus trochenteri]|uniref:hypothetical protein n=1 Tax=Oceaniglobus trochenteri TaxID=2763260 RepID=UPI001CFFA61A|nr:hypothetical protein [Oceaniglobus trochenteri]